MPLGVKDAVQRLQLRHVHVQVVLVFIEVDATDRSQAVGPGGEAVEQVGLLQDFLDLVRLDAVELDHSRQQWNVLHLKVAALRVIEGVRQGWAVGGMHLDDLEDLAQSA